MSAALVHPAIYGHLLLLIYPPQEIRVYFSALLNQWALGNQSPCQMMIGVYNQLLSKVFRFHDHSQKVIGSLGEFSEALNIVSHMSRGGVT